MLDEFHTYDGAQGTDVAMLLRRLGIALKSHWPDDDPAITEDDRARPLGKITPVATSATLGDRGRSRRHGRLRADGLRRRLRTADSVITESRLSLEEWVGDGGSARRSRGAWRADDASATYRAELRELVERCDQLRDDPDALTREVFGALLRGRRRATARELTFPGQ